jgi:hypothetical protein
MTTPVTEEAVIFGYDLTNGTYTINRKEAAIVRMTFYVYVVCELSHERIAFHFNRLGILCPEERWTDELVYSILTNPIYIGLGVPPDILEDIEAWEQAQK